MATNNKTLNTTQRKMLDKLYQAQFDTKEIEVREQAQKEYRDGMEALNANIPDPLFDELVPFVEQVNLINKQLSERYKDSKINFNCRILDAPTLKYSDWTGAGYNAHTRMGIAEPVAQLQATRDAKLKVVEQMRLEASAKIYGLDVTFEAIRKDIDAMLAKLA